MLIYILTLTLLFAGSPAVAGEDVLAKQAAVVEQGKTSITDLLAQYNEMIRRQPKNPQGYLLAAAVYDRDESKALYEKALALKPDYAPARIGLARYLLKEENVQAALPEFQKALALSPNDQALKTEAINAAVRASRLDEAKALAGQDPQLRLEIAQTLVDLDDFDGAKKALADFGLDADTSSLILNAKARLAYVAGQKKNNREQLQRGVDLWLEAWRKSPTLAIFYSGTYPRQSLVWHLARARRWKDLRPVLERGIALFPQEYPLYEGWWKTKFDEPKSDYSAERQAVRTEVETLLKTHRPSPDLFRTAALGYKMADAPDEAERVNQQLLAEFPYSLPSRMLRMSQVLQAKDPQEKVALLEKFNHDFPTSPLFSEYLRALDEMNVPDAELLKASEEYLQRREYSSTVLQIGEIFLRRNIYLDRLEQWINRFVKGSDNVPNAWDARLLALKGKLLLAQGRQAPAEKILRPLLDLELQGYSHVDKGKAKFYLAEVVEAQNKLDEALDLYAQSFVQSQRYLKEAGEKFEHLYRQLRGSENGMDEFLSIREGMYQAVASSGIERGAKIDKPLPDFEMLSLAGERVSSSSLRGKVAIVNFWATWCGPCRKELPHLQEFYEKTKNDPGVAVLAITTDENRALVAPFIRQQKYTFPVLFDEGLRTKLEIRGIPTTFIVDPGGTIRLRMVGFNSNEPLVPYLQELVAHYRVKDTASNANTTSQSSTKVALQEIEQMPRGETTEAEWKQAKKKAALDALAKLSDNVHGQDLYYAAMLAVEAEQWAEVVRHLKEYVALSETDDYESRVNRPRANMKLTDAFLKGGLIAEGEAYYSSDPIALAMFVSRQNQHDRAIGILESFLQSNPPTDRANRAKSLIVIMLGSANKPDEMARRLQEYRDSLTLNGVANHYSSLARLYDEAGRKGKSDQYTNLLFELSKNSKDGKAVDGVVNAHIGWMIRKYEAAGEQAELNKFLERVRSELADKKTVMDYLSSRDTFQAVLNKPAKELEIDFAVNGERTDLKSLRGRVVLLDFFAHWCGPCIAGFPFVREIQKKYESKGLTVLGISGVYGYYRGQRPLTPEQEVKLMQTAFAKEYKVTWPMLFGRTKTNQQNYGVAYIPHLVLIDRAGIVRAAYVGKDSDAEIEQQIIKLLAEPVGQGSE